MNADQIMDFQITDEMNFMRRAPELARHADILTFEDRSSTPGSFRNLAAPKRSGHLRAKADIRGR